MIVCKYAKVAYVQTVETHIIHSLTKHI